jgi:hypothetical protein
MDRGLVSAMDIVFAERAFMALIVSFLKINTSNF